MRGCRKTKIIIREICLMSLNSKHGGEEHKYEGKLLKLNLMLAEE